MLKVERARRLVASLAVVALSAGAAHAQTGVITGKVTTEAGAPLVGANVFIRMGNVGTTTNDRGMYTLTIPDGRISTRAVTMTVRSIGYVPQDRAVTLTGAAQTQNFALKSDPFRLEQMVVTGVADSTSTKSTTFSIAHVSEDQVKAVPAANPIEALAGKVPGLKVSSGVGNPGGTPAIRLRGSTSLQVGGSEPLIIVDGVITTNSIADIDAQDIESVEVLKGAAGASFYGSNAANGVIAITTKRGRNLADNHVTISARTEYGKASVAHWPTMNRSTSSTFDANGAIILDKNGNPVLNGTGFSDTPYPTTGVNAYRDQLKTYLGNNDYYNTDVQVGLRRGNTNFNSAFSSDHNGGILPFRNGQFRQNARLNVDQGLGDKVDLSASLTYGVQHNDYPPGSTTGWFELLQAPPFIDLVHPPSTSGDTTSYYPVLPKYASPNQRANPLYALANQSVDLRRERLLGNVAAHYRVTDWLRLDGNYGTDRLNTRQQNYNFRGYLNSTSGIPTQGSLSNSAANNVSWNSQMRATATKLWKEILSTTSVAYQLENETDNSLAVGGSKLNVNATPDLAALDPTQITTLSSSLVQARTTDYMVSQTFNIKDRYVLDGLYRRDGSSLFGPDARWSNFYRVAGAYRLSEDIHIPGVQELKLHAARGTAGLRPGFSYQYETYTLSAGQVSPATLGNRNLKPAVLTENEYGINAQFLQRFAAELTYADRITKDAFLLVPLSPAASGGFSSQWQNAASIGSKTLEGSLQTRVFDRANWSYDITLTGDHTTQKILSMNRAPFRVAADNAQGQNVFWYQPDQPLGIIYGTRYVHSFAQLKENAANAAAVESDYVVNPLGYLVKKSARGTAAEAPIVYVDAAGKNTFVLGDVNPDLNFGFTNDVRVGAFSVHALFDGQKGGKIYNFTKQWMFQDLRSGDIDQSGKAQDQKVAESFYSAGLYNGLNASEYFVEDGSYVKLRELSVGFDVPAKFLPRVGLGRASGLKLALIGRNLYTWTNYTGFDPDITSGSDFNYRIDGFKYPPFRTVTGQVEIRF
jgi:TonB-linked SusC/RagA family outer membrane protein